MSVNKYRKIFQKCTQETSDHVMWSEFGIESSI